MAIMISDKKKCSGCSACYNICPMKCIEMKADVCGFKYPQVNKERCIECGKCEAVCPYIKGKIITNVPINVFAAWSNDEKLRYDSTSGGVFSEIAKYILEFGGLIAGAVYDPKIIVKHELVNDKTGLSRVRQSKYAQSDINTIYKEIQEQLKTKEVLFCGTPCQVAGLKNFLNEESRNLTTIDFICRGVNSPKALHEWIREVECNNKSTVDKIWFKYKEDGWHKSPKCTKVIFTNGSEKVYKGKANSFMYGYLGPNLYIRPSCGACIFKGEDRCSDITLGDFWGIEERLDDDLGTSLVIANTEKGKEILNIISKNLTIEERNLDEIYRGNVCFKGSVKVNSKSEEFLSLLGKRPFSKMVYCYSRKTIFEYISVILRRLKRLGENK